MPIKKKRSAPSKATVKSQAKQVARKKIVRLLKEKELSGFPKGYKPKSGERFPTVKRGGKTYIKGARPLMGADRLPHFAGVDPAKKSSERAREFSLLVPKVKPASKGYLNDLDAATWKIKNALKDERIIQRGIVNRAIKKGKDPVKAGTDRKIRRRLPVKGLRLEQTGWKAPLGVQQGRARELKKRLMTIAKRAKKVESVLAKRKAAIKAKVAKKKTTSRKK